MENLSQADFCRQTSGQISLASSRTISKVGWPAAEAALALT
jgi:hypothetical protein